MVALKIHFRARARPYFRQHLPTLDNNTIKIQRIKNINVLIEWRSLFKFVSVLATFCQQMTAARRFENFLPTKPNFANKKRPEKGNIKTVIYL